MKSINNSSIVLNRHPQGKACVEDFRLVNQPVASLKPGEFLVENIWLSIDPYTRPRLNPNITYVEPIKLEHLIQGETVGRVIQSKSPKYQVGQLVFAFTGWQKYCVLNEHDFMVYVLPDTTLPESVFLGVAGTPGRAAYFGINKIAKPKPGETMVVSAATGAVGSVAGQLGKIAGCKVIGIAGTEEKCRYAVETLGFDSCLNYNCKGLAKALAQECPGGVDVYFENVGGRVSAIVARYLNQGARVPICGSAALYDEGQDVDGNTLSQFYSSLPNAPESRFFLVTEWFNEYTDSIEWLIKAVESGQLHYRETITQGLEQAPQAFIDLLESKHIGKQLVRV